MNLVLQDTTYSVDNLDRNSDITIWYICLCTDNLSSNVRSLRIKASAYVAVHISGIKPGQQPGQYELLISTPTETYIS